MYLKSEIKAFPIFFLLIASMFVESKIFPAKIFELFCCKTNSYQGQVFYTDIYFDPL